ncbi:MAG: Cna domain protein, partial [Bryobacterales bacterium]|nr:Cna domain protein [Bryobacterales bacterium]
MCFANKRTFVLCAFCVLLAAATAPRANAQAVFGSIIGTVTDNTGAVVPGAKITITDVNRGTVLSTTTNDSGNYTQTQLQPGTYTVSVEKPGFRTFTQENVSVTVGLTARADSRLEVGATTQEVTVTEAPPGLESDRAEVNSTLGSHQIIDLPVFNRNFTNLTLLVPGATINTFQHAAAENPQQSTLVNTNGQEFSGTNYLLDGMNNNDAVLGIVMVNPAIDSVAESTITTSNYDAEFTQAGGAVVRVQTKSGTNQLHGSLFEFLQNDFFQARDSFTQGLKGVIGSNVPELRWNQFGGSLGGPIIKDKLFGFGDYQGTRRRIGASQTIRVPTALERTGNLSDLGVPIFDPNTGNADGTGRVQFPGNVIQPNRISTPAANVLAALPLPNLSPSNPAAPNYAVSQVEKYDTDQFDVRVDHFATEKLRSFGRYSYLSASLNAPGPFGLFGGQSFPAWNVSGTSDARNQNLAISVSYTLSPTFLTEFRYGFSRYRVITGSLDSNTTLADTVGIPGLNIPGRPDTNGLPDLNINGSGGFLAGYRCNCPLHETET